MVERAKFQKLMERVTIVAPKCAGAVAVYPLILDDAPPLDYLLESEAREQGLVSVTEDNSDGSRAHWGKLRIANRSSVPVLFVAGVVFKGAGQNRVLNTTMLVDAESTVVAPATCVEHGRWSPGTSEDMSSTGSSLPPSMAHTLDESVSISVKRGSGHQSDQDTVWAQVNETLKDVGGSNATKSICGAFTSNAERIRSSQQELRYSRGSSGMAIAVGGRIRAVHLFNSAKTCEKLWDTLLSGAILEGLSVQEKDEAPNPATALELIVKAARSKWTSVDSEQSVGCGEESRSTLRGAQSSATVVCLESDLVHACLFSAN